MGFWIFVLRQTDSKPDIFGPPLLNYLIISELDSENIGF